MTYDTRRTIHDMSDDDVAGEMWEEFRNAPTYGKIAGACASVARRISGLDPRPLVETLQKIMALSASSSQSYGQFAEMAHAALAEWETDTLTPRRIYRRHQGTHTMNLDELKAACALAEAEVVMASCGWRAARVAEAAARKVYAQATENVQTRNAAYSPAKHAADAATSDAEKRSAELNQGR